MVHSMTAFARVEQNGAYGTLSWELRSVNHRYLEPHLRLPDNMREVEVQFAKHCVMAFPVAKSNAPYDSQNRSANLLCMLITPAPSN